MATIDQGIAAAKPVQAEDRFMLDRLAQDGADLIARAVDWCGVNTGSRNLEGLATQADLLVDVLKTLPGEVARTPLSDTLEIAADGAERRQVNGEALLLTVRSHAPIQVILTGHYDTVFPADSTFRQVVTRADGALNGPGVADMKGGISVMLGALGAFERHALAHAIGYRVLLSPDEETGSIASAPLLAQIGRLGHVGMTYEPAMDDGGLAGARKGSGNFHVVVRGRAAHAGRDFDKGRNAVVAALAIGQALAALNGQRPGVTVNLAKIDGGGALNIVPDLAVLRFNARFPDAAAQSWLEAAVDEALAAGRGEGLSVERHGGVTRPAKPLNLAQARLLDAVRETGAMLGQSIGWKASGGVCEGNNLFAVGLPNVDTLGVRGGDIHSEAEFARPESFVERAQLSALLLARLARGEIDGPALRAAMT
ncbi:hydrolase [Caulobacter segnis]